MAIDRVNKMSPLQITSEVLGSGPIEPEELGGLQSVYIRGLEEVRLFLTQPK